MRFLIAAALFVTSVFLLLFGLAQKTIWSPPESYSLSISRDESSPILVIPHGVLTTHPGAPTIKASGSDRVFIATGRQSDIEAWVGGVVHEEFAVDAKKTSIIVTPIDGKANYGSPLGSDLWRSEVMADFEGSLKVSTKLDNAVLIASDGVSPAASRIELIWPIVVDPFWSNFLLISGAVLLAAAFIFNTLAYQNMRRHRGPRRRTPSAPKPPKYRFKSAKPSAPVRGRRAAGRAAIAAPASIVVLALLTGCSAPSSQVSPSPSSSVDAAPPASLTAGQIERIVAQVSKVVTEADTVKDASALETRVTGPSLALRTAHYLIQKKSKKVEAMPSIAAKPLTFSLPAATSEWPRTVMVVTDQPGETELPQLLVLQQQTPRSQYLLWYNIRLMPGAEVPEVVSPEVGATPVDSDSLFLKLQPLQIPDAYGDVINKGAASLSYSLFDTDNDEFYKQVSQSQITQAEKLKTAKMVFAHALAENNAISLSTTDAGALVAVYMTDTTTIKPKDRSSAVAVSGLEKILLGADGSTTGVRTIYGDMLLFYVPALSEADKAVRLLGVSQGLISVRALS
ncbi:MAG: hypothetical protein RL716_448 [Actinomycetota bacterium]|jgi:hypothetical protein